MVINPLKFLPQKLKKGCGEVKIKELLKSPVPQTFKRNNARISDDEYRCILVAISRVQDEIVRLMEIDEAEGASQATYRQRLACETFIQDHQSLLHWTRRIPTELLVTIFISCTDDNTVIPWNLSQVCCRWRTIALNVPRLWRKVPFIHHFATEQRFIDFLAYDYLRRSGVESIIFSWLPSRHRLTESLYSVLLDHVGRWGDVHLILDRSQNDQLYRRFVDLNGRLPLLYALKLTFVVPPPNLSLEAFRFAPQLRYIEASDPSLLFVSPEGELLHGWPWKQVTHISTQLLWPNSLKFGQLSTLNHLVYLRLRWSWWSMLPPGDFIQVTFPACKYLHIQLHKPHGCLLVEAARSTNFLKLMHFPVLQDIFMEYAPQFFDGWIITEVSNFVQRHSTKQLHSFHWHKGMSPNPGPIYKDHALFSRLLYLPSLRLTLPCRALLKTILTHLVKDRNFMPELRKLHLLVDPSHLNDDESEGTIDVLRDIPYFCHKLDELRICVSPSSLQRISPWEIVFKLDDWEDKLLENRAGQSMPGLEEQLKNLSLNSQRGPNTHIAIGEVNLEVT